MKMRKSLRFLLITALAAMTVTFGSVSVYAEPDEMPAADDTVYTDDTPTELPPVEEPADDIPADIPEPVPEPVPDEPIAQPEEPAVPSEPDIPDTTYDPDVYDGDGTDNTVSEVPDEPYTQYTDDNDSTYGYDNYTEPSTSYYEYETESYSYDIDNDYYDYTTYDYYENDAYEPIEPDKDTSALEISGYEVTDTQTLTAEDWEALKNGQEASRLELKATPTSAKTNNAFAKLKEDSKGGNDDWVFLAWGIGLITAGVIAVGAVVFTSLRTKKRMR